MAPDAYLVAAWDPRSKTPDLSSAPKGLALAHAGPGLAVWVPPAVGLAVHPIDSTKVIVGDVFSRPDGTGDAASHFDCSGAADATLHTASQLLMRKAWGRYVLLANEPERTGAFRDPSGALDCATWRTAAVRYFASRIPLGFDPLLPRDLAIDWAALARQLSEPLAVSGASALRGIEAIAPGALWVEAAGRGSASHQLWRPAEIARRPSDGADPGEPLRACVRSCVATLIRPQTRVLGEISGGLDSAIVAACVTRAARTSDPAPSLGWINFATEEIEGDEREYALAVAAKLDAPLTVSLRGALRYDNAGLDGVGSDFRIGLTALDPDYDAELVAAASAFGAEAIVSGQGGDAVFQQMAIDEVLVDRLRGQGRLDLHELLAHCRRTRKSIWRVLCLTLFRAAWRSPHRRSPRPYLQRQRSRGAPPHPWLEGTRSLSPAKAAQIWSLAASQNVFGPSRRSDEVRVLHPLLSQPIVELVLQLPSYVLTRGGEDRALAREAFAEELPDIVLKRRAKGSLQSFYGRAVADSLELVRPWLLEGLLVRHGLIRADRLAPLLDADVLIVRDVYVELLHLAAVEAWARGWSQRIESLKERVGGLPD